MTTSDNRAKRDRQQKKPDSPPPEDYFLASGVSDDDIDELAMQTIKRLKHFVTAIGNTPAGEPLYFPPAPNKLSDTIIASALRGRIDDYVTIYDEPNSQDKVIRLHRMLLSNMVAGQRIENANGN